MTGLLVSAKQHSQRLKGDKFMMNDEEFLNLTRTLFQLSLDDGDLGYMYWTSVIKDMKEMRAVYLAQMASANPEHDK